MNGCTSIFEFTTSEVCKNHKKINEIPCLIVDKHRKLRDLTQLVKVKGKVFVKLFRAGILLNGLRWRIW